MTHQQPSGFYWRTARRIVDSLKSAGVKPTLWKARWKVLSKLGLASTLKAVSDPIKNGPGRSEIRRQKAWSSQQDRPRELELVLPVSAESQSALQKTIQSVRRQSYPHWTLRIECGPGISVAVETSLRKIERRDPRIRVHDANAKPATESAPPSEPGRYIGMIHAGDRLTVDALYQLARTLSDQPDLDVVYTDEAHLHPRTGRLDQILLKPDWSPELLLSYNYIGSLCLVRHSLFEELVGSHPIQGPAREWDLWLKLKERNARFQRVPRCCYVRTTERGPVPSGTVDRETAAGYHEVLQAHLDREGLSAEPMVCDNGVLRLRWRLERQPKVSVIILNKDSYELVKTIVSDLRQRTTYRNIEIIIVDNASTDPRIREFYREETEAGRLKVVPFNRPFNYSAACNLGARAASGELLLFLNNDMQVITPDWLEELLGWAMQSTTGVVGTKLLYPNGHIQHAGMIVGPLLVAHIWHKAASADWGPFGTPDSCRNYLAVTGACHLMRRSVFDEIGGYDERFQLAFSDIALCLRAWKMGYRIVYTPHAGLIHYESYTRGQTTPLEDIQLMARELRELDLRLDPFFHPELAGANYFAPRPRSLGEPGPRDVLRDYLDMFDPPGGRQHSTGISPTTPQRKAA